MPPHGAVEFVGVLIGAPDPATVAGEIATLLGLAVEQRTTRFQLPRGALWLEPGAPGLTALVLRGRMPEPWPDTRGLDLRFIPELPPAPATLPPGFLGIDHVVVQTPDADAGITLWRDRLGIRLALDRTFPDLGMRLVFLRSAGVTIELASPLTAASDGGPDRLHGLSFAVADLARTRTRLLAAGLDVSDIRPGRKAGTRVATVRTAPCGIPTLLVEPAATVPGAPSPRV